MKTIREFSSPRTFSLWDVLPVGEQLLLRSPSDGDTIDLIFKGVFYMELPQTLKGVTVGKPSAAELQQTRKKCGRSLHSGEKVFVLASGKQRHLVGAKILIIEKNSLGSNDPSFYTSKYLHESQQEDFYRAVIKESAQFLL